MVYIAGSATTAFGEFFEKSLLDLCEEATIKALEDAQTNLEEIEAVYVSSMLSGALYNLQHLGSQLAGRLKIQKPVYFYEAACASGGMAVHHAWKDVKHQYYQKILVVGGEKMTEFNPNTVNQYLNRAAGITEQASGISFCGLYALMAEKYLSTYQYKIEDLAYGPALMHQQAHENPHAHFYGKKFSIEEINQARSIAAPLNLLHCSPLSDGASAIILQSAQTDVEISQSSVASDCPDLSGRSTITSIPATKIALKALNLPTDWQTGKPVLEVHDCFSIALIMALEDLEICPPGTAPDYLKNLWENPSDLMPLINPSGGLKAGGHPVGATGVKQIHSLYQRLSSNEGPQTALAHNIGGTGGTAVLHFLETC